MTKILLTVVSVLACYAWGTLAWFTGGLKLSGELPTLALLTNVIYGAALFAPFIRARLTRFNNTQLLVALSCLSAFGLIAMMNEAMLPYGYLAVGLFRLFLMPVMMSFIQPNLGPVGAVVLLNGGFSAANAVLKPVTAQLVTNNLWRYGLGAGIVLIAVSAITAYFATSDVDATEASSSLVETRNPKRLGGMILVLIGIQLFYGVREIAVYRVAQEMLGSVTAAGQLEAITESAMLIGVFLTPLLRSSLVIPMLAVQGVASLAMVAALQFHNVTLLYAAQVCEGLSYAVLERLAEVMYLRELGGFDNAGLAYQWIDSLTRVGPMPTRLLASSSLSLQAIFGVMAGVSILIVALHRSPLALWTGNRLFQIAESNETPRHQTWQIGIARIVLIIQIKTSRQSISDAVENRVKRNPHPEAQLLSHRIR
jgi:hypothetical protein